MLIKSTLSNLPIYFMFLFVIPKRVTIRLEKIQRDFLWGGGDLVKKPHLVKWSIVCMEKQKWDLGFRSLSLFNKALLGKWSWRFVKERCPLWKCVIIGKYGLQEGAWCTKEMRERLGVGLCKAIRNGWDVFKDKTSLQVGLGNRVKFWNDKWCGETPFEGCVPESLCYHFFQGCLCGRC